MLAIFNGRKWSSLANRKYVATLRPQVIEREQVQTVEEVKTPVEKVFTVPTGVYKVEYTYLNGANEQREWKTLELEGYINDNEYCRVAKDAIDTIYKQHKEGKKFVITNITQI